MALEGLNARSNLKEQRSSHIRQPVHCDELTVMGLPFLGLIKMFYFLSSKAWLEVLL